MPVTVLWAAKGGSGTTVVTAALALSCATDSLLVDLAGDVPLVLGLARSDSQGIGDWLCSDAPPGALADLAIDVDRATRLVPRGRPVDASCARWPELVDALTGAAAPATFIDAGTGPPPPGLLGDDVRSLLVTRPCYLALQRAVATGCRPDGVILVVEHGRSLRPFDVEHCLGAPVIASVSVDVAISRAVDAGLLRARLPRPFARELRPAQPQAGALGRPRPGGDAADAAVHEARTRGLGVATGTVPR